MRSEAYTAKRIDAQLTTAAREFFAQRCHFRYDTKSRTFYLSTILSWFGEDFGNSQASQLRAIAPYLPDETARRLAASGNVRVSFLSYDWKLNDQKR